MTSRIQVDVNEEILIWARRSRGFDLDEAAYKLGIKPERLAQWEDGVEKPTPRQVRNLAKQYVRPICTFFLPAPPTDDEPGLKDFRRMHEAEIAVDLSHELAVEIRLARERRAAACDLAEESGVDITKFSLVASVTNDPEEVAGRVRRVLGVTTDEQSAWRNKYEAFAVWRSAVERLGVLVFQTGRSPKQFVELNEARGFSIFEETLPVIVVNGKDAVSAKCFTLIHELSHLALGNAGICDLHNQGRRSPSEFDRVEIFCNRVAAATLVPKDSLVATPVVRSHESREAWTNVELSGIARRFWVSWEVSLRRLVTVGLATNDFYSEWRRSNTDRYPDDEQSRRNVKDVKLPMSVRVIRRSGRLFPRIVFDALREGRISYSRASSYLGAGAHHLQKIERAVFDSRYAL